jgi:hypothetical protein
MPAVNRCDATLKHNHGTTRCELPTGHVDEHIGECSGCLETERYPEDAELHWHGEGVTSWL